MLCKPGKRDCLPSPFPNPCHPPGSTGLKWCCVVVPSENKVAEDAENYSLLAPPPPTLTE